MSLAMKARQKVKKKASKDKVFGCDLLEHLQVSGSEVPQVLKCCTEFVEEQGIVDGIYRLCGISSNVQKLRQEFEMERNPDLNKDTYLQDVHCVSSLCKAYFRQLPNPLLTYQLYDKFADAIAIQLEQDRLVKIKDVLKELPRPHYRTLEFLMRHLVRMASFSSQTNMHARNLAIVWAPNLLRSKDIEASGFSGTAAFMEVRIQSIVVEFILTHVDQLFGDEPLAGSGMEANSAATAPEDYFRSLSYNIPSILNHGDGPPQMRPYHTIIDISDHKRKGSIKARKWKSIFNLGRSSDSKRKVNKHGDKEVQSDKMTLRPAKSMDSLSSAPYAADGLNFGHGGLARNRSPKSLIPVRRDSFGSPSKQKDAFLGADGKASQLDATAQNSFEYEEEASAKSEPTTPKAGRSSAVGNSQTRSPKSTQNRAEKCVGVHISGPFSVTLPFHITSNLSRLTRGMECPSLNYGPLYNSEKSSPRDDSRSDDTLDIFLANLKPTPESNVDVNEENDIQSKEEQASEMVNSPVSAEIQDTEIIPETAMGNDSPASPEVTKEIVPPKEEDDRLSLEVQDTFSFLDHQDTNVDPKTAEDFKAFEDETQVSGYISSFLPGDIAIMEEELGSAYEMDITQVAEFSVEPPPDDLFTEDEDQMYFIPTGCLDLEEQTGDDKDLSEDIYLSACDELSPLELGSPSEFLMAAESDAVTEITESPNEQEMESGLECEQQSKEEYCIFDHSLNANLEYEKELDDMSLTETQAQISPLTEFTVEKGECPAMRCAPDLYQEDYANMDVVYTSELGNVVPSDNNPEMNPHSQSFDILDTKQTPTQTDGARSSEVPAALGQEADNDDLQSPVSPDGYCADVVDMFKCNGEAEFHEVCILQNPESIPQASQDKSVQRVDTTGHAEPEDAQTACEHEFKTPNISAPQPERSERVTGTRSDRPVSMTITSILAKVHQVKSVPVVPPKPQFAKLPPALRSKIHVGSALCSNQDTRPPAAAETAEELNDSVKKQRCSSWKSSGSISFDTAVALAKERHLSQHPVRRMQTYCFGNAYDAMDSTKVEELLHLHKQGLKSSGSRIDRPLSCSVPLNFPKATDKGSDTAAAEQGTQESQGQSARNRMSLPRIGKQLSFDEPSEHSHHQRRSLL
ncbi:rho GTPase-activating protein 30 [Spea bombifrons]|uniref:rho GTPase-activating protein 30 n=1 Tax=Spea bombifrons TaxID=233779 RepID=UPI00234AC534|nr:rho GTPase-activating protein 30 [Spea bombifrons]